MAPTELASAGMNMPKPDPTAEQIAAELADHLAASAGDLERSGIPAAEAEQQAREKFGDVEATLRQCYWVQQGDSIMFRRVTIALVVLLCLGLIATTANSWLAQSRMTQQLAQLNEQLASLTKTQESLQDQQKPLSITGLIYDGDKSKPVANHEVGIARLSDLEVVRRVKTDQQGKFESGPIPDGDYFIFGSIDSPVRLSRGGPEFVQGPPIYLYAGVGVVNADLDVGYKPTGRISLECSPALQAIDVDNRYRIVPSLMVTAFSRRWRNAPWNPNRPQPEKWPLYISIIQSEGEIPNRGTADRFVRPMVHEILTVDELKDLKGTLFRDATCYFPEGSLYVGGLLMTDVVPIAGAASAAGSEQPNAASGIVEVGNRHQEVRRRLEQPLTKKWFLSLTDSNATRNSPFMQFKPMGHSERFGIEEFKIATDQELRIRVELPADWDRELRQILDTAKTIQELQTRLDEGKKLFHKVKLSLVENVPPKAE